tara:strand:+ start:787 stop:1389 length:603 start_codon:yes stop_codon:yes gene_type:complete
LQLDKIQLDFSIASYALDAKIALKLKPTPPTNSFRISTLVFVRDEKGRLLLLKRTNPPNSGKWSPIGGKLDFDSGESPYECAMRETLEEINLEADESDFRLFGYVSEKSYDNTGHWLMFLFDCTRPMSSLPPNGPEGSFGFFYREEIEHLEIPGTDHQLIWPLYDKRSEGFTAIRADCSELGQPTICTEGGAGRKIRPRE